MRAAVINAPGSTEVSSVARREPGAGEIRVRVDGCGVCGSNLAVWQGQPWFTYPLPPGAPGHEGWGWIDALGDQVEHLRAGDRIAMLSSHAFAEFDITRADHAVPIPASLDGVACPAEAIGCAVNVFRRAQIAAGETVAIVGAGFLGMLVLQMAVRAGAYVVALSRREWVRELTLEAGAVAALPASDAGVAQAKALVADGMHCVVEAAGAQQSLDLATQLTRERGRLVIAGYHQDGRRVVDMQTWNWRGLDVVNAHERDPRVYLDAMRDGIAAVADGTLDVAALCTHTFPLDQLGAALDMMRDRPAGFLKAVVRP